MLFDECPATERSPVSYVVPPSDPVPVTVVNPEPPAAAVKDALIAHIVQLNGSTGTKRLRLISNLGAMTIDSLEQIALALA